MDYESIQALAEMRPETIRAIVELRNLQLLASLSPEAIDALRQLEDARRVDRLIRELDERRKR